MGSPVHALTTSGTGTGSGSAFTIPSLPSGYLDDDVICILFSNDGAGATLDLSAGSNGWMGNIKRNIREYSGRRSKLCFDIHQGVGRGIRAEFCL